MTEFNEAVAFIETFLNTPMEEKEKRTELGQQALTLLRSNKEQIEQIKSLNNYYLGAYIKSLKADNIWKTFPEVVDWWSFEEFCKKKLNVSLPTANTLDRVYTRAQKAEMTPDEVEKLGWATADAILRFCENRQDVDLFLKQSEQYDTKQDFLEALRNKEDPKNLAEKPKYKVQYKLSQDEYHTLNSILLDIAESYGKRLGENMKAEEAILLILVQWKEAREEGMRSVRK